VDRRKIHDEFSGAGRSRKAVGAERHFLHGNGIGKADEDDAGGIGDLTRRASELPAHLNKCRGLSGRPVPDGDLVTGVQQAPCHGKSHHSEPEIADPFSALSVRSANACHFTSPSFAACKSLSGTRALPHISPLAG
jgi:hypothetical protein